MPSPLISKPIDPENDNTLERLEGLIERVTFHSEETGYAVLRVSVRGSRELITVVGHTAIATPGEYLTAIGHWFNDKNYGRQFKSVRISTHAPKTLAGIERYLGSGMVKGVGPILAERLVKAFGAEVFDVIEKTPERLHDLERIGKKRIARITQGWANQKIIRGIMVFLHGHGVSTSKSVRIFKTYGQDAIKLVTEDPYRLARDIRGIGFRSADIIAQKLGIDKNDPRRARAGVSYTLSEASGNGGHCGLPRARLVAESIKLLDIERATIEAAIEAELASGALTALDAPFADTIYLTPLMLAEKGIAWRLGQLAAEPLSWPTIDADAALGWVEKKLNLTLAESQKEAVRVALKSKITVITGGPGVGKTTLVRAILTILAAKGVTIELAAPTGRAAKRLAESSGREAKTIHRLLEVDPETMGFKRNDENPLECDLLVVDECSMLDVVLANNLLKAVRPGAQVIFVGDVDQLPAVGPGAFLSDLIESGAVPVIRLTEVFRQAAESWIIRIAHQINRGIMPTFPGKADRGDCYFVPVENIEAVPEKILELVRERLPRAYGWDAIADIQVLTPMNRGGSGARSLNEALKAALNPAGELSVTKFGTTFSVGDKVMQIENNYEREVYNGDIGFVRGLDAEEETMTVEFDARLVEYPYGELDELVLAYATTVHKSQGSEYPVVVIPLSMQHFLMLKRNLIYTAVTRGKKLVVIVGEKRALAMAVKDRQTERRISALEARLNGTLI